MLSYAARDHVASETRDRNPGAAGQKPVVLAKEVATLCALSGERLMLGVGPGWNAQEFAATGSRIEERGPPM